MDEPIWIERRKWPDISHYRHHGVPLGEDEHGLWFGLRIGDPVYRGDEVLFHGQHGGLIVVPPGDASWMAWFLPPGRDFDLYVDIVSHVVRTETAIMMVDVDFDVVRYTDGRVELVDEDEFAEHQVLYGYPAEIVELALTASQSVLDAVQRGEPPFDGAAAATWAARAGIDLGDASRVVGDGVEGGTGRDIGRGGTVQAHDEHP